MLRLEHGALDASTAVRIGPVEHDERDTSLGRRVHRKLHRGDVRVKADSDVLNIEHENVDAPEHLVARFKEIQRASRFAARFDAAPGREFETRVSEVATQADPRTQSFRVTFTLPQPEGGNLLPGMTATVTRNPPPGESVEIVVPAIAIFADAAGSPHVWIVDRDNGTVERRSVRTGDLSETDSIVVLEGLVPGEDIAVSAVSQIRDGMTVRPIEEVSGL